MSRVSNGDRDRGRRESAGFGRGERPEGLWIFAHRGDSFHAPENTLEAAQRGLDAGADAWEFDVQLTRDGAPIVLHDDRLGRTTDVATRFADDPRSKRGFLVADFDLAEIQTLDAGSWFVRADGPARSAGWFGTLEDLSATDKAHFASGLVRIPTLADALDWTRSRGWRANVELKSFPLGDPRRIDAAIGVLKESGMDRRLIVSSFDHDDLLEIRRRWIDVPLGALAVTPLANSTAYLRSIGATSYHVSRELIGLESLAYLNNPSPAGLRQVDLRELHADGLPIHVYTVNSRREAADLQEAGVSGIFSDDPASLSGLTGSSRIVSKPRLLDCES
jgi:glycerophosphoryl diester phosphodiesterase